MEKEQYKKVKVNDTWDELRDVFTDNRFPKHRAWNEYTYVSHQNLKALLIGISCRLIVCKRQFSDHLKYF